MPQGRYQDRTDSLGEKLSLLQNALAAGNHELGMSLAESIKDTISFEHQLNGEVLPPQVGSDEFSPVDELPDAWAQWANGWSFCKIIAVFETVGIARDREPVDISVGFRADQTTDLQRELRVARRTTVRSADKTPENVRKALVAVGDIQATGEETALEQEGLDLAGDALEEFRDKAEKTFRAIPTSPNLKKWVHTQAALTTVRWLRFAGSFLSFPFDSPTTSHTGRFTVPRHT